VFYDAQMSEVLEQAENWFATRLNIAELDAFWWSEKN